MKSLCAWDDFLDLREEEQARFLLDVASAAWERQEERDGLRTKIQSYLATAYKVSANDVEHLPSLMRFLEDPDQSEDFASFFDRLKHVDTAAAALDLASYACGFVCRVAAEKMGIGSVPDPVNESVPEIYEYYRDRASFLELC